MSGVLQTEYEFELPLGYVDQEGTRHTKGKIRLATAADEILPLNDERVKKNAAYHPVIVLSRVVMQLGSLTFINTKVIEELYSKDFAYLQDLYNRVNRHGENVIPTVCPKCEHKFNLEQNNLGED
ncbi:MAG: hypothetical protein K0S11_1115 [Gammaproteobacteria bacterium]|jgi:hypothetical protein|nr:hypothetical protein [Gammaproteobacteria bacterium]